MHAEPVQVGGRNARVVDEVVLEVGGEPADRVDVRVVERRALHDQRYRLQAAYDGYVLAGSTPRFSRASTATDTTLTPRSAASGPTV